MDESPIAGPTFQGLRTTLRPPRAVVVFSGDGDWLSHAAQAVYECGRVWGGSGFILIPHHNGVVHPDLIRLAAAYDPDYVLTIPITIGQYEAMYPGLLQIKGEDGELLHVEDRIEALRYSLNTNMRDPGGHAARDLIAAACTPHRYMVPKDDGTEVPHEQQQVLALGDDRLSGQQPLTRVPRLTAGVAYIKTGVPGHLQGAWALAAAIYNGIGDPPVLPYADALPIDFDQAKSLMRRALPSGRRSGLFSDAEPQWTTTWSASDVGTVRVQPWMASQKDHLVVVGHSADDFALALGWQVQFGNAYWIPETPPFSEKVSDLVVWGLGQDMLSEIEYEHRRAVLTSTTLGQDLLRVVGDSWVESRPRVLTSWTTDGGDEVVEPDPADEVPPEITYLEPDALDFADGGLLVVRDQYDVPLALPAAIDEHGQINLLVDLPPIAPTHPELDAIRDLTWQIDVDTPEFRVPRMRGVSPEVLQAGSNTRESFVRLSRSGLSCYSGSWGWVMAGSTRTQAMAKPRLQFPSLLTWAGAMAASAGMSTRFSDAGHRIEVLRRRWGSRATLTADWAGDLRPVLLGFKADKKDTSAAFPNGGGVVLRFPEAYLSFQGMSGLFTGDADVLRAQIDRLCGLRVLQRGLILRCEACMDLAFITLDEVASVNVCRRCGSSNALTQARWNRPADEPIWWYDLHPAARELLAADAGVGLLAAEYLRRTARSYEDTSELEFVRGTAPVAEADLLAVVEGRVILGEAKATPTLGPTKRQRAAKARKIALMAAALRADEVVLCTSSNTSWSSADLDAVRSALASEESGTPVRPTLRTLTGLAGEVVDVSHE